MIREGILDEECSIARVQGIRECRMFNGEGSQGFQRDGAGHLVQGVEVRSGECEAVRIVEVRSGVMRGGVVRFMRGGDDSADAGECGWR